MLKYFACVSFLTASVLGFPNGAPTQACNGLIPSPTAHKAKPSQSESPYTLETLVNGQHLELKVSGGKFKGFAIQVRKASDNSLAGEFEWDADKTENTKYMKCDAEAPKASITHSKARSRTQLEVVWLWPDQSVPKDGDYIITFTIVAKKKHFWVKTAPIAFSLYTQL